MEELDKSYSGLMERHLEEHRKLFRRVKLDLGPSESASLPTNERLLDVSRGDHDPGLVVTDGAITPALPSVPAVAIAVTEMAPAGWLSTDEPLGTPTELLA